MATAALDPNVNGKVPVTWLLGFLTVVILSAVAALWRSTDAKAEAANQRATNAENRAAVAETRIEEVLRRLDRIEGKVDRLGEVRR